MSGHIVPRFFGARDIPEEIFLMIINIVINNFDTNFRLLYYADFFGLSMVCKTWAFVIKQNKPELFCNIQYFTNRIHRENRDLVKRIIGGGIVPVDEFLELRLYVEYKKKVMGHIVKMLDYRTEVKKSAKKNREMNKQRMVLLNRFPTVALTK
jgi:hypothetical protein